MKTEKPITPATSSNDVLTEHVSVLHGPNAFNEIVVVSDKLNRAVAMADVLNIAAFADKSVSIPSDSLQDYMLNLALLIREVRDEVTDWEIGKSSAP